MKKMKKLLVLVLALALAASLAACGSGSSDTGDAETEAAAEAETEAADEEEAAEEEPAEEETDGGETAEGAVYKVGIVQYVDDASLNQIEASIEAELAAKGEELGVTFEISMQNAQADSTTINQIITNMLADEVDVLVPIATPTAMVAQSQTEESQPPVVFSAVTDPVGAGLVESLDAPGSNITGTSDAIDVEPIMSLMLAANPDLATLGLLYDNSQDSSKQAILDAKAYCDENGIAYVEKTGTDNTGIMQAADSLVAEGVDAVFTPTDNTVQTAEMSIYEKFIDAGIPHYACANSFALNGAFCGYGVDYVLLGTETADMVVDILVNGADPASMPVEILDTGIATINTDTAEAIGLDYSMFEGMVAELVETVTAEEFD